MKWIVTIERAGLKVVHHVEAPAEVPALKAALRDYPGCQETT